MSAVIGFIPARAGSKGFPGKNVHLLNGKPMMDYAVEAALDSKVCSEVLVSSEDEAIRSEAIKAGANADVRPLELAQDASTTDEVLAEFIQRRQLNDDDIIILLQPTSPLRNAKHISEAFQWYLENTEFEGHAQLLLSVYKVNSQLLYAYRENGAFLEPICDWVGAHPQRQSLPQLYLPNGAIYVFSVGAFRMANAIPKQRIVPFVMTEEESIDVDTEEDLRRCSYYLMGLPERRNR